MGSAREKVVPAPQDPCELIVMELFSESLVSVRATQKGPALHSLRPCRASFVVRVANDIVRIVPELLPLTGQLLHTLLLG